MRRCRRSECGDEGEPLLVDETSDLENKGEYVEVVDDVVIVVVRVLGCCARLGLLASDCGFAAAAWEQASHRVGAGDTDCNLLALSVEDAIALGLRRNVHVGAVKFVGGGVHVVAGGC